MKSRLISLSLSLILGLSLALPPLTVTYGENDKRKELEDIRKKQEDKQSEIEENDKEIEQFTDQMESAQNKIADVQKKVDTVEVELKKALEREKVFKDRFNERIRILYQKGEMGYMATLLAAESFGDFLARYQTVRLFAKQDYALLSEKKKVTDQVKSEQKQLKQLIDEQQNQVKIAQEAYQKLMKDQEKNQEQLEKLNEIEELHEQEMIQINKQLIASGKLQFPYKGPMMVPCKCSYSSAFGMRYHPIRKRLVMHEGDDLGGPIGTPIYAATDGVVVESRASSGYGWIVTIYHGELNGQSVYTRYAHSWPHQVKVKVGEEVGKGDIITAIGNNGMSTGPHLHFEVRVGSGSNPPAKNPRNFY